MDYFPPSKYIHVGNELIEKIESGEFAAGQPIPSERELIDLYQVSRITIRKSIDELVARGYLTKVQGKGTFVKSKMHRQNLFSLTSCHQDILNQGMVPSTDVISATIVEANTARIDALKLTPGALVFRLERVYYADNYPVNYTITYLPIELFPGIEKINFVQNSLYSTLENEYGIKLSRATRTIEAIIPSTEVAKYLSLDHGKPVLLFTATTFGFMGEKEIPVENFECCYRSDRFKFYINQVR